MVKDSLPLVKALCLNVQLSQHWTFVARRATLLIYRRFLDLQNCLAALNFEEKTCQTIIVQTKKNFENSLLIYKFARVQGFQKFLVTAFEDFSPVTPALIGTAFTGGSVDEFDRCEKIPFQFRKHLLSQSQWRERAVSDAAKLGWWLSDEKLFSQLSHAESPAVVSGDEQACQSCKRSVETSHISKQNW